MIQQVNLLRHNGSGNNPFFKNPYVLISAVFLFILLIISAFSHYSLQKQQERHQQLEQQLQAATEHLQTIQTRFPSQIPDKTLQLEIQHTQQRYQSLLQVVELLTDDQSDRAQGFSRYLTALADQADANVWLTRIYFDSDSHDINLQGSTFKPEQIPALLQRLHHNQAFKGRHFAKLLIEQKPENGSQTNFSVSSNIKTEADKEADKHDAN
jgi:Tfp pilus assembly protein PilN